MASILRHRDTDMTEGNIARLLINFALPLLIGNIFQQLYNTVIDYKTDRVKTPEEIAQRARHYTVQLQSYAAAMERICGKPVKECVLYFLNAGKAVSLLPEK